MMIEADQKFNYEVHAVRDRNITPEMAAAIAEVMAKVPTIAKDGTNVAQNYKYASEAAISNTMRPLMAAAGLSLVPVEQCIAEQARETKSGGTATYASGTCRYLLLHKSGGWITVESYGAGFDTSDKAAAKLLTQALKYALVQTFLLGRGDDGDDGNGYAHPEAPAHAPAKAPFKAEFSDDYPDDLPPKDAAPEPGAQAWPKAQIVEREIEAKNGKKYVLKTLVNWPDFVDEHGVLHRVVDGFDGGALLSTLSQNQFEKLLMQVRKERKFNEKKAWWTPFARGMEVEAKRRGQSARDLLESGEIPF